MQGRSHEESRRKKAIKMVTLLNNPFHFLTNLGKNLKDKPVASQGKRVAESAVRTFKPSHNVFWLMLFPHVKRSHWISFRPSWPFRLTAGLQKERRKIQDKSYKNIFCISDQKSGAPFITSRTATLARIFLLRGYKES